MDVEPLVEPRSIVDDGPRDIDVLEAIQQRVLWLASRMIDYANHDRPDAGGIKVGGHQASSASMVSIMTALWFGHIDGDDKVAVKPHASPVYHAIKYLTGELDRSYLTRLREFGGLQAYPSRTKDPDVADFSTGSVGLGAVAPLFAAAARRYIDCHFPAQRSGRFIALVGDAELDEGNVWEAVADPALAGLGNVMWIVDVNRQSLDRVVPEMKARQLIRFFSDSGWHVEEAKYGSRLQAAFARPGGEVLRDHIDTMTNEEYQSLFGFHGHELRRRVLAHGSAELSRFLGGYTDAELGPLIHNLGGHDLDELLRAYRACDQVDDRPSVVFAYTIKGWGLPFAGDPLNHAALLNGDQIASLRREVGLDQASEWDRFAPESQAGRWCARVGSMINNQPVGNPDPFAVPPETNVLAGKAVSTQETFGRTLGNLASVDGVGEYLVTTSPDVAVSTNLGGWINKVGVFTPEAVPDYAGENQLLKWRQGPSGQHVELGLSEMNLFLMLHALGLGHDLHGQRLMPVGTVYDPFVCRGLDALIYALYNGARFVLAGTPSGVTLAPEGGAHQSSVTASLGLELPGLTCAEPAYAVAADWLLCDALAGLSDPGGGSVYLRLSTRPVDQAPFSAALERIGPQQLRHDILAGGYRLVEPYDVNPTAADVGAASVILAASGAVMPEVVAAATMLADEGVAASVIDITNLGRLYAGWTEAHRRAVASAQPVATDFHLGQLIKPAERAAPIVTVHDSASHTMAWLGSVFGQRTVSVGVDDFGQSGSIDDLYQLFGLRSDQLVNTALVALSEIG